MDEKKPNNIGSDKNRSGVDSEQSFRIKAATEAIRAEKKEKARQMDSRSASEKTAQKSSPVISSAKKEKQARAAVTAARARAWCRMNVYRVLTAAAAVRTSAGVAAAAGVVVIAAAATKDENENDDPRAVAVAEIASHDPLPPFFA